MSRGHLQALDYVLGKALTLYTLATKRDRAEMVQWMGCIRAANHAGDEDYKKTVQGLS